MRKTTKRTCFAAAAIAVAGCAGVVLAIALSQRAPSVVFAAPPPQPKTARKAAAGMCSAAQQPNIGKIAKAVSNGGNGPFITDFTVLSEAAWCTFEWLNWPQEGQPKLGDCLNAAGGQTCQVRWEQWLPSSSVYCKGGAQPNPKTGCPGTPKTAVRQLREGTNPGPRASTNSGIPVGNTQPTGFALPDKNNTPKTATDGNPSVIFYESVEEPNLVAYIIKHGLYSADGQQTFYNALNLKGASGTAGLPPPSGLPATQKATPLDFPVTAFELKPSWYVSTPAEVQSLGMINAQGIPPVPLTNCKQGPCPVGLTGFHIIWKVFKKSPWFWATFEFENNATPPVTNFNIAPMLQSAQPNAYLPDNTNVSNGPYVPYDSKNETDPMSLAAAAANAQFRKMFAGTPLANYKLVGVQVAPTMPDGSPSYLANNQLETDFGAIAIGDKSGNPQAVNRSSSCITCHYNASIGSTNTTGCQYDSAGNYSGGSAYFRRVPIYLRNQDAKPPFTNQNGLPACSAYSDANGNPAGYTGAFNPSVYTHQCESKGSYVSGDFVWSLQEAQWKTSTNGCPASRPPAGAGQ